MLTGQTENRQCLVIQFQADPEISVFLLSFKPAGSGLNLTPASYVVLFDPSWNPAVEAQAIDRTHPVGQTSQVIAYRLLAPTPWKKEIAPCGRRRPPSPPRSCVRRRSRLCWISTVFATPSPDASTKHVREARRKARHVPSNRPSTRLATPRHCVPGARSRPLTLRLLAAHDSRLRSPRLD